MRPTKNPETQEDKYVRRLHVFGTSLRILVTGRPNIRDSDGRGHSPEFVDVNDARWEVGKGIFEVVELFPWILF